MTTPDADSADTSSRAMVLLPPVCWQAALLALVIAGGDCTTAW
jgi:hypothetical protein